MCKNDVGKILVIDKDDKKRQEGQNGSGKESGKRIFFKFMRIEPDKEDINGKEKCRTPGYQ
jgi:hypothetical protein